MAYARPMNTVPLSSGAKRELLSQYSAFYRELAGRNSAELNKKLPRSALAGSLDRIGELILEEAKAVRRGRNVGR